MLNIAVIGAGRLGIKVAGEMAYHGHKVMIYDPVQQCIDSVPSRMKSDKEELIDDGILRISDYKGMVSCMTNLKKTVENADFIFESVVEDLDVKVSLMERITEVCKPSAIIGTASLNLKVDDIFSKAQGKERCMGLRFLFPVFTIPEVEFTSSQHTSQESIRKVRLMLEDMDKILFVRSGNQPLILNGEQRQDRKRAYLDRLRSISDIECEKDEENVIQQRGSHCVEHIAIERTNKSNCTLCRERIRNSVIFPCQHIVTCYECAKTLVNKKKPCPVCSKDITDIIKVHHS